VRIEIIAPSLPPELDGIGDYTALLAAELAGTDAVRLLVPKGRSYAPVVGVETVPAFPVERRAGVWELERVVRAARPDWLLIQYNPFSYGKWGLNLSLPAVMRRIRRSTPGTQIAMMVHERYVPAIDWKLAIMAAWQRPQFHAMGRACDVIFFSIEPWLLESTRRFPGIPLVHLPVGSNVPHIEVTRAEARARLKLSEETVVLGLFGTAHVSRLFAHVREAADAVRRSGRPVMVVYMGPHGNAVRKALGDIPSIAEGPLAADEISRRLAAVDVYLAPYIDGVSTRRGAFIAGLQHRLATVGTYGVHTDRCLLEENDKAFALTDSGDRAGFARQVVEMVENVNLRNQLAAGAGALYESTFSWRKISEKMVSNLAGLKTR
jgi:glycosyltransferase involved in cell wall biosynthesis